MQKRISNKVNKTFLSRLSAQEKLAKEILKALETEKIWNRQSFSLLHNLGRSIAKFLKEETGITSDHNRNHSIELHLFSYRYCGHCKVFFNQKENSKHVHPSTASSQPNPPQIMDLNNNVTVKKSPRIKLNPLLVRFTENLEETMVKICENAEELEKFNQYLPMSMQLRRLFLTGKRSKVDVYLSGSRVYGLGSSKSELDIYVNISKKIYL